MRHRAVYSVPFHWGLTAPSLAWRPIPHIYRRKLPPFQPFLYLKYDLFNSNINSFTNNYIINMISAIVLRALTLLAFVGLVNFKRIIPRDEKPLKLDINNLSQTGDYIFHFYLEEDSLDGFDLEVKFPPNMGYNIPAPCTAVLLSDSDKLLTCTRQNAELALVRINNLPSSKNFINIIALRDIPNPAATVGTGIFSLRVLKGTENEFDFNYFFDQVAFSPAALVIPAATLVIVANDEPNLFANYKMDITFAVGTIPAGGKIRLKIPESLTFDKSTLAITPTPSLGPGVVTSFYRDFVILSNLIGQTIPTLSLLIQNIKNFPYAGGTPDFVFQLRADGTETLLEQATVAGPTISPTMLPNANVIFSSFEVDLSQSTLYQTDVVEYELKFKIKNAVPSNGGINIDYPASFTVTRCWGISNVIDISESTLATCTIAANRMRISNIRGIAKDKFVRVGFRAVNPPSALATEPFSPFTIGTYYDSLFLKNIDLSLGQTVNILGINSPSIVTFPTAGVVSNTEPALFEVQFTTPQAVANLGFRIYFASGFQNTNTATNLMNCQLTKNAVAIFTGTCSGTINSNNQLEVLTTGTTNFGPAANTDVFLLQLTLIAAKGLKTPLYARDYQIQVSIYNSATLEYGGTGFCSINPQVMSPALTTIRPFTNDYNHITVFDFSIYIPFPLEAGQWSAQDATGVTFIEVLFPTPAFATDLGTGKPTGSTIPCYGIVGLKKYQTVSENDLKCVMTIGAGTTTVKMTGYDRLVNPGLVRFHLPNIKNNVVLASAASLTVRVSRVFQQETKQILQGTFTLPTTVDYDIFDNPNNDNGVLAAPTNISPEFVPNQINVESYTDIKFTPSRTVAAGGGMLIFYPKYPVTNPAFSLTPKQNKIICSIKGSVFLTCYTYPDSSLILIEGMPVIPSGNEIIVRITGFVNPGFVEELNKSILIWTFTNAFRELEQFKFTELSALAYGPIMDAYVLPYEYQSLKPDVTYDWVFRLGDDLPVGGSIILYFPANFYDLQSSVPCPTVELIQGVTWINPETNPNVAAVTLCSAIWATSIGKITQINPVKKGEVIVIRIKGVKNPSQEGWTPYFQVETRNQENYIIDRLQTIPQVYINRKFDVKNIIFDGFFMIPNNGQIIGNYYLSFYPQTPIPANGMIEITLPSAEFSPGTSFPAKKYCRVGGSLKTFKSCTWSAVNPVIQIFLDKRFEVEAGQEPIRLHFPHIKNFNAELSSGVVKVTTYFDGLVLDESGSEETNRKCSTVKTAAVLAVTNFDYYPRNEGNIATYKFRITPTIAVGSEGVITLEFPYEFPKGLGSNIVCMSAQLLIGALDPLWCKADDWFLRITNHKGWAAGTPIDIEIFGIVNPNRTPLITDQIGIYLFNSKESVTEYNYGMGPLAFSAAPMPLLETSFTTTNALPRFVVTNTHRLVSTISSATINQVNVHFPLGYDCPVLSPAMLIRSEPSMALSSPTFFNNSVSVAQSYVLTANTAKDFVLQGLSQPYDMGTHPLYIFELEDKTAKNVVAKTFPNLINRNPANYQTTEVLIKVNNEQYLSHVAGTISDAIEVRAASAPTASNVVIGLTCNDPGVLLNDGNNVVIPSGQTVGYFRIGYNLFVLTREIIIKFSYVSGKVNGATTYSEIKPLKVIIAPSTSVAVKVTEFAALAAGGRSMPLAFYLDKAPFTQLTVGIFQLGRLPDRLGIYPPQLVFEPGEKKKFFWISTDYASKGSVGSLVFTMTGTTKGVYSFPTRQKDFFIYEGRNAKPVILFQNIYGPTRNNQIMVSIKTDTHCTCYFSVVPRGTLDVLFSEVKNKKLRYDNFKGKYLLGEVVFSNTENTIDFAISDLEPEMDQMLKIFIQNTDGALADAIYYPFTTLQPETPIKVYIQSTTDAITASVISSLQSGIALGSRITTAQPDTSLYFEQKKIGETVYPIPYPENNMNADLQAKKDQFIQSKVKAAAKPKTGNLGITGTIGAASVGNTVASGATTVTTTTGIGGTDEINKLNQKTQALDLNVDLGKSSDQFLKESQEINKFRLKKVIPLTQGQELSSQDNLFTDDDPTSKYANSAIHLPKIPGAKWIEFYVTPASGSSETAKEVVEQVRNYFPTLKTTYPAISTYYSGSLLKKPIRWSPMAAIYLKTLSDKKFSLDGIAASEDAKLSYIITSVERSEYDALNTISQTRIRYLASIDPACTELALNSLSIKCDGSMMPETSLEADIVKFTRLYQLPTAAQLEAGLDMNNYKPLKAGSKDLKAHEYADLVIDDLKQDTVYVIFASLSKVDNGSRRFSLKEETIQIVIKTLLPGESLRASIYAVLGLLFLMINLLL